MGPDDIFKIVNTAALISWILLIFFPFRKWTGRWIISIVIGGLALCYSILFAGSFSPQEMQSFNTLDGVMELFTNPVAVLIGWIHYLAFDLMVGLYIIYDSRSHEVNRWVLIPCMILTFMAGPMGLLLYMVFRVVKTRKLLHNYS